MSPRTPVFPLLLALALWAVGLASSSRGLERCAADPAAPAARAQGSSVHPADEAPRPAALGTDALAAGGAVTPAEARRGAPEAAEEPCTGDFPASREPAPPPRLARRPSPGSTPGPLYLQKRSLLC